MCYYKLETFQTMSPNSLKDLVPLEISLGKAALSMVAIAASTFVKEAASPEDCSRLSFPRSCSLSSLPLSEQRLDLDRRAPSFLIQGSSEEYVLLDKTGAQRGRQAQIIAMPFSMFAVMTFGVNDTRELSAMAYTFQGSVIRVFEPAR